MKLTVLSHVLIISLGLALVPAGQAQSPHDLGPQNSQHFVIPPGTRVILEAPAPKPVVGCQGGCLGNFLQRTFSTRCWGHHDEPRTGNLHSESVFAFGSSRAYFGEACRPIPPGVYGCGQGRYGIAPYTYCNSRCGANGSPGVGGPVGVAGAANAGNASNGGCANGNCGR